MSFSKFSTTKLCIVQLVTQAAGLRLKSSDVVDYAAAMCQDNYSAYGWKGDGTDVVIGMPTSGMRLKEALDEFNASNEGMALDAATNVGLVALPAMGVALPHVGACIAAIKLAEKAFIEYDKRANAKAWAFWNEVNMSEERSCYALGDLRSKLEQGLGQAEAGGVTGLVAKHAGLDSEKISASAKWGREHSIIVSGLKFADAGVGAALAAAALYDPSNKELYQKCGDFLTDCNVTASALQNVNRATHQDQFSQFQKQDQEKEWKRIQGFAQKQLNGESNFNIF